MKKIAIVLGIVVAAAIGMLLLWPRSRSTNRKTPAYSTTVELSGTPGASFSGEYLRDGKRVAFSGVLPWSLTESNISRWEIRKAKADDTLVLDAHGGGSTISAPAVPGTKGIRLNTEGGWSVETLR